ncbi:hypothetical protein CMI37_34285 [Candidatus Pacearchaeota archaeon]|nr:hypothetical protein [Candidatus Pacearchaeota archaeon]|tara:strand:+ start:75 stop:437 length:363 start_codon:yes stop_codon:yes gene_type:complete
MPPDLVRYHLSRRQEKALANNTEVPVAIPTDSTFSDKTSAHDYVSTRLKVKREWIRSARVQLVKVCPGEWPGESLLPNIARDANRAKFTIDVRCVVATLRSCAAKEVRSKFPFQWPQPES